MGQPITVVAKPSSNPGVVRYETNRAITGMGHERYHSLADVLDDRPVDELARRILEHGGVDSVHVNSNVITVRLAGGSTGEGLDEVIGGLYLFYTGDDAEEPDAESADAEAEQPDAATGDEQADEAEAGEQSTDAEDGAVASD